ncbi:hypothetical protein [Petroclostridium sp. X23]|uniref:hypothetical protein n=1 Tax=Petroclostridium sp. X23 TaxID=3045146 RepID=UPI0024AD04C3|nr:hypothetical protein [Petroclostridium sp. X23]WHH57325.1 hypothetical protein QKW49_15995 [Petroclostridium sp. X23]
MALGVPIAISLGFGTVIAMLATGKYPVLAAVHRMIPGVDSCIFLAIPCCLYMDNTTVGARTAHTYR